MVPLNCKNNSQSNGISDRPATQHMIVCTNRGWVVICTIPPNQPTPLWIAGEANQPFSVQWDYRILSHIIPRSLFCTALLMLLIICEPNRISLYNRTTASSWSSYTVPTMRPTRLGLLALRSCNSYRATNRSNRPATT